MLPKETVLNKLNMIGYQKEFVVIFTKSDGTQRMMKCMMDKPKEGSKPVTTAMPVMDLEKGSWRSFRLDSVLSIEVV
jgi:hypothetical protein